jgi:hypothetical protein
MDVTSAQVFDRPISARIGVRALGLGRNLTGGILHEELFQRLGIEILEDSPLARFPGFVHSAGSAFPAGTLCHDAAGNTERSLHGFHGLPERYLGRWSRQPGAATAALFALDQACVGELSQDACQLAAWNMGLGRNPLRRYPLPDPG